MDDRRKSRRDKVVYGGVAAINARGSTRDCVVRNISDDGATIEFGSAAGVSDQIALTVAKKARTYPSKIIWRRGNTVGLAFDDEAGASDLGERLRKSEKKKRELQRKIKVLLGEA